MPDRERLLGILQLGAGFGHKKLFGHSGSKLGFLVEIQFGELPSIQLVLKKCGNNSRNSACVRTIDPSCL
jgi:hypothetical protein